MSETYRGDAAAGPSRGRPRIPATTQQERLFDAAERLLVVDGDAGVSVQAIVREAHMSSRSFYEFFESKEALCVALARRRTDAFLEQLDLGLRSTTGPGEGLEGVEWLLRLYVERWPRVVVDLERLGGRERARVREIRVELRRRVQAMIEDVLGVDRAALAMPAALPLLLAGLEEWVAEHRVDRAQAGAPGFVVELATTLRELLRPDRAMHSRSA